MGQLDSTLTTPELLQEIGERLRAYRLQQNLRAADVARSAGLAPHTVGRAERGEHPSLESVLRILRALGRLDTMDAFLPRPPLSPVQLAALSGRERQRARGPRRGARTAPADPRP